MSCCASCKHSEDPVNDIGEGLQYASDEKVDFEKTPTGLRSSNSFQSQRSEKNVVGGKEVGFLSTPSTSPRSKSAPPMKEASGKSIASVKSEARTKNPNRLKSTRASSGYSLKEDDLQISMELSSLLGLDTDVTCKATSSIPTRNPSAESNSGEQSHGLSFVLNIQSKLNKFRKNMVAVAAPDLRERDRGVQIEGIYDFCVFGDKRIRARKMQQDVFHERPAQESDESRSSSGDSSDPDESSSAGSGQGVIKRSSARRRTQEAKERVQSQLKRSYTGRPEVFTRWGEMVAKMVNTKFLDFTGVMDKANHHAQKEKFRDTGARRGLVLSSVRERARLVAQRASELARRVSREKKDKFDHEWKEEDLLIQLLSTEYFDTLALFANAARKILSCQPSVAHVGVPCKVFGDIHGQFRDLLLLLRYFGSPDEHNAPMFVFNGDFVDRGCHQLEVIGLLLAFKILLPEKVWLIRGNHEDRQMNKRYGFAEECYRRLGAVWGPKIFELIQKAFDMLPLAGLVEDRILCVHGGLGDGQWTIPSIAKIQRPLSEEQMFDPWIFNLLWSDPIEDDCTKSQDVFGVHVSPRGGMAMHFGWNVTKLFCARNGLSLVIRSHQSKKGSPGFDIMHEKLLMRVFSARDYERQGNDGAVLLITHADPEDPKGLFLVRPQVLRSTRKSRVDERRAADADESPMRKNSSES